MCSGLCGGKCYGASDLGVNPLKGGPATAGGHGPHSCRLGVTQGLRTYPGQPARSEAIPEGTQSQRQRWGPEDLPGLDSQAQKICPPPSLPASARREPGGASQCPRDITRGHEEAEDQRTWMSLDGPVCPGEAGSCVHETSAEP